MEKVVYKDVLTDADIQEASLAACFSIWVWYRLKRLPKHKEGLISRSAAPFFADQKIKVFRMVPVLSITNQWYSSSVTVDTPSLKVEAYDHLHSMTIFPVVSI